MSHIIQGHIVEWRWTDRDGKPQQVRIASHDFSPRSIAQSREQALEMGYPGHAGGWHNWFVTDFHEWLASKGWTRCACHPKKG